MLPELDLSTGLRIIDSDGETNIMKQVAYKVKNFVLYFDQYDLLAGNMWEDIVVNPIESLPKVLSPRKVPAGIHVDEGTKYYDNEGSSDVDFVDSDYELDDGMMTYFMTMLMMGWLMRV